MDTRSSVSEFSASAICPSSPAVRPAPKSMKIAIPFAVLARTTLPASASAASTADGRGELERGHDDAVRPPADELVGEDRGGEEDQDHVGHADAAGGDEAAEQDEGARQRAHDHGLQQAALGVPAHGVERQEDGEDRAQEHRREHRQAEQRRAGQRAALHAGAAVDAADLARRPCPICQTPRP